MINFIDLTKKIDLIVEIHDCMTKLKLGLKEQVDSSGVEVLLQSPSIVILEESMHELAKNAIDAKATKLEINLKIVDEKFIEIHVIDNGCGFSSDKLGLYPTRVEDIGISAKLSDCAKLGGAHKGLLQASVALHRNGGQLVRKNNLSDTGVINGAVVVFSSPITKCIYTICDFHEELDLAKRQHCSKPVLQLQPLSSILALKDRLSQKNAESQKRQHII